MIEGFIGHFAFVLISVVIMEKVTQKVVLSILRFLRTELDSGALTEDSNESLEVAVQCLESAYNLERAQAQARNVPDLVELFSTTSDFWTDVNIFTVFHADTF